MSTENTIKESRFQIWIEKHILPFANSLQRNRYLQALQSAFMTLMPIMLVGSIVILLTRPWADYTAMAETDTFYGFFKGWQLLIDNYGAPLLVLRSMTLYSISLWVAFTLAYFLSKSYNMNSLITGLLSLLNFFVLCTTKTGDGGLSNDYWGGEGLFAAIVIAIFVTELFRYFTEHKIGTVNMPPMVPPALKNSFAAIFPVVFVTTICSVISIFFSSVVGVIFPAAILNIIHPIVIVVDNVFGLAISSILTQVVWWFGIHNTAVTGMLEPLMMSNYTSNAAAYAAGTAANALPHIWTESLWWNWMVIGGSGATLGLAFMLLKSKSKQIREVGKVAIIPSLFNINEPIIFGLPITLNPLFIIPWIVAPTLNGIITYICMSVGLVSRTFIYPGWNIPTPIGEFLSTMDIRALFLAMILVVIDAALYYPFFKVYEKQKVAEEMEQPNEATEKN